MRFRAGFGIAGFVGHEMIRLVAKNRVQRVERGALLGCFWTARVGVVGAVVSSAGAKSGFATRLARESLCNLSQRGLICLSSTAAD